MKRLLMLALVIGLLSTTSCKDDEIVDSNVFDALSEYLTTNNMDLPDVLSYHGTDADVKFVTAPPAEEDLAAFVASRYIIDIRSAADFAAGHIEGAVNAVPVDGDLTSALNAAANAGDKRIVVVCYTGQTACYTTALLRLAGYQDAQALKWGMSGWNSEFDKWSGGCGNSAETSTNWKFDAAPSNSNYTLPELDLNATDGATILQARVEEVMKAGFKGVAGADVLASPDDYFVNNYFSETDYTGFGHIAGAYRINPLTVANGEIANLDPTAQVVTYCYTGQTSAIVTAYLRVLGYDAYSLKFGMNGLYNGNSAWASNQWGGDSGSKNLSYVTE